MDYGLYHKTLTVEWVEWAHTLMFDQQAVNLSRMEVRHKGERKTVCVTVDTEITEVLSV